MTDDGERENGDGQELTPPEPVDLTSRRQERDRARSGDAASGANGVDDFWRESADDLETQAREMVRMIRENAGELGERVQQAIAHTRELWEESATIGGPIPDELHPDEPRARGLARRWVKRDVLVDPDLPAAMSIISLHDTSVWRVEVRERGESRALVESTDPYTGDKPGVAGPTLPVWDYSFPTVPDIESGERRERLDDGDMLGVCERCHGAGKRSCAHCAGKGFVNCADCRGRGRKTCPTCHGRGRIADANAERRARASKSYFQVHAERMAQNAVERLADLSERLRQDYGAPLPPSAQWAPTAPASGETLPCPTCVNGTIACTCNEGKRVCPVCHGTELEPCPTCRGAGKVIRHQEIARRFDTRIRTRVAPPDVPTGDDWVREEMLRRVPSETVWEGSVSDLNGVAPESAPSYVWTAAQDLARTSETTDGQESAASQGERRALWRRVSLTRTPLTRLEYAYAGRAYVVVAAGVSGGERFWSESFPPRWSRVTRFFQAVVRDINGETNQRKHTRYSESHPAVMRIPVETGQRDEARPQTKRRTLVAAPLTPAETRWMARRVSSRSWGSARCGAPRANFRRRWDSGRKRACV